MIQDRKSKTSARCISLLLACVVFVWCGDLSAHEPDKLNAYGRTSLRLSVPYLGGFNIALNEMTMDYIGFQLIGIEASHTFSSALVTEFFLQSTVGLDGYGWSSGGRIGFAIEGPGTSRTWRSYFVPMVGYHFANRPLYRDGGGYYNDTHNMQTALAYDVYFGGPLAFSVRTLIGADNAFSSKTRKTRTEKLKLFERGITLGLRIGLSWWDIRAFE